MLGVLLCGVLLLNLAEAKASEETLGNKQEIGNSASFEDVCKYKKGVWSPCNRFTQLETREDQLRTGKSSAGCSETRQITRNCKKDKRSSEQDLADKGLCVYEKSKHKEWSECQSGVKRKTLELLYEKKGTICPKVKVVAKKCKINENKDKLGRIKEKNKAKEKKEKKKTEKKERNKGKKKKKVMQDNNEKEDKKVDKAEENDTREGNTKDQRETKKQKREQQRGKKNKENNKMKERRKEISRKEKKQKRTEENESSKKRGRKELKEVATENKTESAKHVS